MKKTVLPLIAFILCLPQLALGVTFQETLGTSDYYISKPFSTATKKSTFTIDAKVVIPHGEYTKIPLYEVGLHIFTEEEINHMATALGHDPSMIKKEFIPPTRPWHGDWTIYEANNKSSRFSAGVTLNQNTKKPKSASMRYLLEPGGGRPIYLTIPPFGEINASNSGLEEATRLAQNMAGQLAPELSLNFIGASQSEALVDYRDVERYNTHGDIELPKPEDMSQTYTFVFTRTLDKIPTTYAQQDAIGYVEGGESYTDDFYSYEKLIITVAKEGIGAIAYDSPYIVKGVWNEDAGKLLSFEKVTAIAKTMLPLKYASREWEGLRLAKYTIDRIAFGYTRVMMPNEPDRYIMIPVWDFFGSTCYTRDDDSISAFLTASESLLTINAVTGDIIDRELGY